MAKNEKGTAPPSTELAAPTPTAEAALALALNGGSMETGFEDMRSDEFLMPLLVILQKLSPQLDPDKAKYIPGAKVGQFLDVSTGELFDEVHVIPCLTRQQMVEWKPNRGGFVASHDPGIEYGLPRNEKGQFIRPSGNILMDTRYWYLLRLTQDGKVVPNIFPMTSTSIAVSKEWASRLSGRKVDGPKGRFTPPMWLNVCKITSVTQTKGEHTWKQPKVELERLLTDKEAAIFQQAQDARTTFQQTASKMRPPVEADDVDPTTLKDAKVVDKNPHLG